MSLVDAIARTQQIQAQLASLQSGAPVATPAASSAAPVAAAASVGTATGGPGSFANALAQAQAPGAAAGGAPAVGLSARAAQMLTPGQRQFVSELAGQTGLDPQVVASWCLAEESGGAAASRESQGNNNWLNIGWTDSGRYGTADAIWSNPVAAADATAGWLKGQDTIPGYGRASAGVQSILTSAGQPPAQQIAALQRSGWASSGYPDLPRVYGMVAG